ncbi:MAG: hypothetical protein K2Y33_02320 [Mycolicibacterium frederiksbergense]|uniref:hypothetical protein n=1 Tax=Mycobacterium adipatum TaxID=1682113 RepID=UPI0028005092|nr:hypothetical protein [Mycolicibacterium frederiksbergense]
MCKSSSEPGGPQRCSGDTRAKAARSADDVAALEAQQRDLTDRLIAGASAEPPSTAWGPHIGPPPFADPPNAPDFDQWYAEKLAQNPDYSREHAYGHFYNLAGDVTGMPGYTAQIPEQLQHAPQSGPGHRNTRWSDYAPTPTERYWDRREAGLDADSKIGTDDPNSPFWKAAQEAERRKAAKALSDSGPSPKNNRRVGRVIDKLTRKDS